MGGMGGMGGMDMEGEKQAAYSDRRSSHGES